MSTLRVHYREGQRLRAADLQDEHDYHAWARRRHQLAEHTWGIVYGLALAEEGGGLVVQPGLAVDGYGHELILDEPLVVTSDELSKAANKVGVKDGEKVDLWLVLVSTLDEAGRRWRDETMLHLTPAWSDPAPPPPFDVPERHLDLELWQGLPDDTFPVFLGRVTLADSLSIDLNGRPYAGLVGASVVTPDRGASLCLEDGPRGRLSLDLLGVQPLRLTDSDGITQFAVQGDVRLDLEPKDPAATGMAPADLETLTRHSFRGISYPQPMPQPEEPRPWSLYRTQVPVLGPDGQPTADPPIEQLRLEMFNPGSEGNPDLQRLSIGYVEDGVWKPCLLLRNNCEIEVFGNVWIEGEAVEMPIPADPSDPRFFEALLGTFENSMTAADDRLVATPVLEPQILLQENYKLVAGGEVSYKVRVKNASSKTVTFVRVYASFVNTDGLSGGPVLLLEMGKLEGGAVTETKLENKITVAGRGGQLRITATVTAFAADLAAVTQSTTLVLPIVEVS